MLWLKKRYGRSGLRPDSPCGLKLIAIVGVVRGTDPKIRPRPSH